MRILFKRQGEYMIRKMKQDNMAEAAAMDSNFRINHDEQKIWQESR